MGYGLRYHPGVVTAFTTLRLDQLMLGGMASSVEIGLVFHRRAFVGNHDGIGLIRRGCADARSRRVQANRSVGATADEKPAANDLHLRLVLIPLLLGTPLLLQVVYGAEFLAAVERCVCCCSPP